MRSITTQLRIRRLARAYADYADRLSSNPADLALAGAARSRLASLATDLHAAWAVDSRTVTVPALRRRLTAALAEIDALVAGFGRDAADPRQSAERLREAALGLLLMLRGLDDLPDRTVADWLGGVELARTA
jgi:hypothetical protein